MQNRALYRSSTPPDSTDNFASGYALDDLWVSGGTVYVCTADGVWTSINVGGSGNLTSDIPVVLSGGKTLGRYINGQTIPAAGLSVQHVLADIATEFLIPTFASFSLAGQASPIEVGASIPAGTKTFNWSTTNSTNVQVNSIAIIDYTASVTIISAHANNGSANYTLGSPIQLNSPGVSQQWRINANDTNSNPMTGIYFTVTPYYVTFLGALTTTPSNSTTVRALPQSAYYTGGSNVILNTGSTLIKFGIALPPGSTLTGAIDLDASNASVNYVLIGTISVNDAGGTARTYNYYEANNSTPYSSNHRHQITYS